MGSEEYSVVFNSSVVVKDESTANFKRFDLNAGLQKGIEKKKWEVLSPIQMALIEPILEGRDVLARAKNGTGKTGAYCIPCLEKIDVNSPTIQALILIPTDELVLHISKTFTELAKYLKVKFMVVADEVDLDNDIVHILISTPGRVFNLMKKSVVNLDNCKILIMDEADKLLSQNFQMIVTRLIVSLPEVHQSMLFSPVLTSEIASFSLDYMHHPIEFELSKVQESAEWPILSNYFQVGRDRLLKLESTEGQKSSKHKSVEQKLPLFCLNWGDPNQLNLDKAMVSKLPNFYSFFNQMDWIQAGQVQSQTTYYFKYQQLPDYKKLVFEYFLNMFGDLMKNQLARRYFSTVTRTDIMRVSLVLANLKQDPSHPRDCWLANDELMYRSKANAQMYNRPTLCYIGQARTDIIVGRFSCMLLYGISSLINVDLHGNNLQASHYCGHTNCIIHVYPEDQVTNISRNACHQYGCAMWCPHLDSIPCIFQRDGHYLPCRSDSKLTECTPNCEMGCFKDVDKSKFDTFGKPRSDRKRNAEAVETQIQISSKKPKTIVWEPKRKVFKNEKPLVAGRLPGSIVLFFSGRRYNVEPKNKQKVADIDKRHCYWVCCRKADAKIRCTGRAITKKNLNPDVEWSLKEDGFTVTETFTHVQNCELFRV